MSAEVLREAAALMRERAKAASDGPWLSDYEDGDVWAKGNRERVCRTSAYAYGADAEHIASWHPAVALAVADWLEGVAEWLQRGWCSTADAVGERALTVARTYLGEAS